MRSRVLLLACAASLAACGDTAAAGDGGDDAGMAGDAGVSPMVPAAPSLAPCPDGWQTVTDGDGVVTCDPWPETGYRTDCAPDEAHLPGTPGCARIGTDCAPDGWPSDLPSGRSVVYVNDDAGAGGDGTSAGRALRTIAAGLAAAPPGAVVAVATGTYDEAITIVGGQTVWGACVGGTRLTTSNASSTVRAAVLLQSDGAALHNVSVGMSEHDGVILAGGGVEVVDVVISGARSTGVAALLGSATLRDVVVRDMRADAGGARGIGVQAQGGVPLTVDGALVERAITSGFFALGMGTVIDLVGVAVRDTRPDPSGANGIGLDAESGATLTLHAGSVEGSWNQAVSAVDVGSTVELHQVAVRDPTGGAPIGEGVYAEGGAHLLLDRVSVDRQLGVAAFATGAGSRLDATDLVVRDTAPSTVTGGGGVVVISGAQATLARVLVARSNVVGVSVRETGSALTATDLVARDGRPAGDGRFGRGLEVSLGAQASVQRVVLSGNRRTGLLASDVGTSVDATDLAVRDTTADETGVGGRGVEADTGAVVTLATSVVERAQEAGLVAFGADTHITGMGVAVRDTRAAATTSLYLSGVGLWAQDGARVELSGGSIERSIFGGAVATTTGAIVLTAVAVDGVQQADCGAACSGQGGGFGVVASFGGTATVTGSTMDGAAVCGVVVGADGVGGATALDVSHSVVHGSPIGACVQVDGYDVMRLADDVRYEDVGVALQATTYRLPDML